MMSAERAFIMPALRLQTGNTDLRLVSITAPLVSLWRSRGCPRAIGVVTSIDTA